jgi:glycosyltransferase involved in cell wall biosynthesis
MNILLINHYAGSKQHGMEYRPYYLSREWVKLGHKVTIVAASFSHLRMEQPHREASIARDEIDGVCYVWLKTPEYVGNGVRRAWNMIVFAQQLRRHATAVIDAARPDVVIASSPHPFVIFPAHTIAARCRAQLVFEVRDLWPLTLIELNGMSSWHPFIRCLQFTENYAYRHADCVISTLPKASSYMQSHGMAPEKFAYIGNGICLDEWERTSESLPDEHAIVLRRLKQEGYFIVGYVGGHQHSNALGTIVEAAPMLRDSPVVFVVVGHGSEKEHLQHEVTRRGIRNVLFLPSVPKGDVCSLLNSMDALYIGLKSRPIFRYGISPNKLMDYMMAAKPIIHAVDAGNDIVVESGCGISCSAEDPRAVADAVLKLTRCTENERSVMGQHGKDYVLQHHQFPVLARRFLEVLLAANSRRGHQ